MKKSIFVGLLLILGVSVFGQDLFIDFRYNIARYDPENFFTFRSSIRYISAEKDTFDTATGASVKNSTYLFAPIQIDIMGRATISAGVRGLFLFPVSPDSLRIEDNFRAYRDGNIITVEYCHRGIAYRVRTDRHGNFTFPRGDYERRTIGWIRGAGPQVLSRDFSANGTSATLDWRRVWDTNVPSGTVITTGEDFRTGPVQSDFGDMMAMFNWDGTLAVRLEGDILTIQGTLRPVKR